MGLFDKKYCDVCGQKIGVLGNRRLADGNLCKDCAKKLSPWFSDRKKSTVEEIRQQLEWREENKKKVEMFQPTRKIGNGNMLMIDETKGRFTVATARELTDDNPDILSLADVTGCNLDTQEHRHEIYRKDKDGKSVSYNPPRYEYSYDFYCTIYVNNPYYSEMKFRINPNTVKLGNRPGMSTGRMYGSGSNFGIFPPDGETAYRNYVQIGEEMKATLLAVRGGQQSGYQAQGANRYGQTGYGQQPEYNSQREYSRQPQYNSQTASGSASWTCPSCGTVNQGKFCENCGTPRPVG